MRLRGLAIMLGSVAIRDLVVGSGGITVGGLAFVLGCAYAGLPTLAWFTMLSILGVVSIGTALPVLSQVLRQSPALASTHDEGPIHRRAA